MTTIVTVKAMSEMSRILGWSEREVEFEGTTLGDLLQSLIALDGQSLYGLLVQEGKPRRDYIISVNGEVVTSLETALTSGDRVITMEGMRLLQGG